MAGHSTAWEHAVFSIQLATQALKCWKRIILLTERYSQTKPPCKQQQQQCNDATWGYLFLEVVA